MSRPRRISSAQVRLYEQEGRSCYIENQICANSTECPQLVTCVDNCETTQCVQDCQDTYPTGNQQAENWIVCVHCTACTSNCSGSAYCE